MEKHKYLQWISACWELPARVQRKILENYPEADAVCKTDRDRLEEFLAPKQAEIFWQYLKKTGKVNAMEEQYDQMREKGIAFVGLGEAAYPSRLAEIPDPPLGLYYKGKLPQENRLAVAVVGSRDCSEYGRSVAAMLGKFLGERGIDLISGMARGIDGISQCAALTAGGDSYGVLGCGADICYPSTNQELYRQLMGQGGILSAYPPGTPPISRNFPPRNRIVSGLAMAVVVVEAALKSGTSITVSMALEQGRDVYAVPGRVSDRLSDGCNRLIKQGAEVFTDPESFLVELEEAGFLHRIEPVRNGKKIPDKEDEIPEKLREIWRLLDQTPKSAEQILKAMEKEVSAGDCIVKLMELVLLGKARQVSAGHFCRAD